MSGSPMRAVSLRRPGEVVRFEPRGARQRQATLDLLIASARQAKDFARLAQAVDAKIAEQAAHLGWYDAHVTVNHGAGRGKKGAVPGSFSVAEAERVTGISHQLVAKWRKKLQDRDRYRAQLLGAVRRQAMGGEAGRYDALFASYTGSSEFYTPPDFIAAAREVFGGPIDTDPATSAMAQKTVKAKVWYTIKDDGLTKEWHGRVWLNPPYGLGQVDAFVVKLLTEVASGRTTQAIVLTDSRTDTGWFHDLMRRCSRVCFTRRRINGYNAGTASSNPSHGSAFFYFGDRTEQFDAVFRRFGFGVVPIFPHLPVD